MKEVLAMVKELAIEETKTQLVPVYYKRNGKMIERRFPKRVYTERHNELVDLINERKVFKCCECGEMVSYFELETWLCDFEKEDGCICGCCYEDEMGEDL